VCACSYVALRAAPICQELCSASAAAAPLTRPPAARAAVAARVQRALAEVLRHEEALTRREGVALKAVRASPDLGTAFILWDSVTGRGREAEAALARRAPGLRAAVARALGARRAPRLEWRRDAPSAEDDALGRAYAAMGAERAADAAEGGGAAGVVDSADAAEAVLDRLRER
jgi:ribosome-binding factor A